MTIYAIRHIPSGGYLPEKSGSGPRRGFTHSEPTVTGVPRLFRKKGDAVMALRAWLEGRWFPALNPNFDDDSVVFEGAQLQIEHDATRNIDDMEIVELDFIIISQEKLT